MISQEIAKVLLETKAIRLSFNPPFTYVSGLKAPIYTDNRVLISYPKARDLITQSFKKLIQQKKLDPEVIGGTATAAIPWAAFLAHEMNLPMIYVRPEKKAHGAGKQIEGYLEPGKRVLIVEDLITTGGSSLNSVTAVRNEGQGIVTDVFAIFTYGFKKSLEAFIHDNVSLTTLTNFDDLLQVALGQKYISDEEFGKIVDYKKDPEGWAGRMGF